MTKEISLLALSIILLTNLEIRAMMTVIWMTIILRVKKILTMIMIIVPKRNLLPGLFAVSSQDLK